MFKSLKKHIDLKLLGLLALFYTVVSIVSFIKVAYLKSNGYGYNHLGWWRLIFKGYGYDWVLYVLFTIFIIYTTKKMINKKISWKAIIVFHLFFSFVFGVFIYFGSLFMSIASGDYQFSSLNAKNSLLSLIQNMDYNFIIYFATISVIYAYYYLNKIKQTQMQKLQLETLLSNTKIKILKSQLQPHFLFNTLHCIHALLDVDVAKSKNMIVDLSDLLREIIDHKEEHLIPLKEEVGLLKKYLNIIKVRFCEDLAVDLEFKKNIENALVPSMILQPIVENSIKHGYSPKNIKLDLQINIYKERRNLLILVKNNGAFLTQTQNDLIKKGLGLKNTIERLKMLYYDDFVFKIYNDDFGVTTKIQIPYQISGKHNIPIHKKHN